jgi:hypothetical protein
MPEDVELSAINVTLGSKLNCAINIDGVLTSLRSDTGNKKDLNYFYFIRRENIKSLKI